MADNDGSGVGMMDPAYFVGKKIVLEWINDLLHLDVKTIELTCSGAVACQIVHSVHPTAVSMSKVDFGAK
jgi:RP/EB family microtubule-associated protein